MSEPFLTNALATSGKTISYHIIEPYKLILALIFSSQLTTKIATMAIGIDHRIR
jgi:hypothetical protein